MQKQSDVLRAIGHLNLIKAEYGKEFSSDELDNLNRTLRALQRLVRR